MLQGHNARIVCQTAGPGGGAVRRYKATREASPVQQSTFSILLPPALEDTDASAVGSVLKQELCFDNLLKGE